MFVEIPPVLVALLTVNVDLLVLVLIPLLLATTITALPALSDREHEPLYPSEKGLKRTLRGWRRLVLLLRLRLDVARVVSALLLLLLLVATNRLFHAAPESRGSGWLPSRLLRTTQHEFINIIAKWETPAMNVPQRCAVV